MESDLIRRYGRALSDELDACAVRHRIGETPRPWEFVISLGLGWSSRKEAVTNRSRVQVSDQRTAVLGSLLAEALSHWGQIYVGTDLHKSCKPVAAEGGHVHIEPFELNGIKAEVYACRLEELGRDLGRVIADFVAKEKVGGMVGIVTSDHLPKLQRVF